MRITGTIAASTMRGWCRPASRRCQRGIVAIVAARRKRATTQDAGRSTAGCGGSTTSALSRCFIIACVASEAASRGRTAS